MSLRARVSRKEYVHGMKRNDRPGEGCKITLYPNFYFTSTGFWSILFLTLHNHMHFCGNFSLNFDILKFLWFLSLTIFIDEGAASLENQRNMPKSFSDILLHHKAKQK